MSYCGIDIADNGTIISNFLPTCAAYFPELKKLGVRTELATGSGNCSISDDGFKTAAAEWWLFGSCDYHIIRYQDNKTLRPAGWVKLLSPAM